MNDGVKLSMNDEDLGYFTAQQISEAIYSVLTDRGLEFDSFAWSIEIDLLKETKNEEN